LDVTCSQNSDAFQVARSVHESTSRLIDGAQRLNLTAVPLVHKVNQTALSRRDGPRASAHLASRHEFDELVGRWRRLAIVGMCDQQRQSMADQGSVMLLFILTSKKLMTVGWCS